MGCVIGFYGHHACLGSAVLLANHLLQRSYSLSEWDEMEPEYVCVLDAEESECLRDDPLPLYGLTLAPLAIFLLTSLSPLSAPIQTSFLESIHVD
jgi:hypothetical protein